MKQDHLIEFVAGRAGYGKSDYLLSSIRKDLEAGKDVWVIVPEQQEIVWNTRALRSLSPDAYLHLSVCGFSAIAEYVFRETGGLCYNYITSGGKSLLMWKTLNSVRNELSILQNARGKEDRYISLFSDAVYELKTHKISPERLEDATLRCDDSTPVGAALKTRLQDLSLVYSTYESLLLSQYDDRDDTLTHLLNKLQDYPFFANSCVYIDSFFSITPIQSEIIHQIFRTAEKTVVSFTLELDDTEEQHWGTCANFYQQLWRQAQKSGTTPKVTRLSSNQRTQIPSLQYLEKNLWKYTPEAYLPAEGETVPVSIYETKNPYDEATVAACKILELVQSGARFGEIALIARNIETYHGIIDPILLSYQIPFYISERVSLSQSPVSRLVFAALAVAEYGWKATDIIACAKTGLCGLSVEESDAFERYVEKWNLRGHGAFSSEHDWQMNPAGFVENMNEDGKTILLLANRAKEKLVLPLEGFCDSVIHADSVRTISVAIVRLLKEYGVYQQLRDESIRLENDRQYDAASRERQIWKALCDALDTMVEILGDNACSIDNYSRLFKQIINLSDIGTIPSAIDQVTLGSAHRLRPDRIKHVILLGANEGEFPASISERGYFSDLDKERLELEGLLLSEGTLEQTQQELFWFYRCLCCASESVTVLYTKTDCQGEDLRPSSGIAQLLRLFPDSRKSMKPIDYVWNRPSLEDASRRFFSTDLGNLLLSMRDTTIPFEPLSALDDCISKEMAESVYRKDLFLTQSRIDKFVLCHFAYYCQYVLKITEEQTAEISPVDVGNLIHDVLEKYFREITEKQLSPTEEERQALIESLVNAYKERVFRGVEETKRLSHLLSRLQDNVSLFVRIITKEFENSDFQPYRFEQKVEPDDPDAPPPLVFPLQNGYAISVVGTIDRLDIFRTDDCVYVRVVDYKTGSKSFSMKDVGQGLNTQMLLYLFSVWQMPNCNFRETLAGDKAIRPAGVLYFSARPGEITSPLPVDADKITDFASDAVNREGLLLNDPSVLSAMDHTQSGKYIPVKYSSSGEPKATDNLVSEADFEALYGQVKDTLSGIGEAMISGNANARPILHNGRTACAYCKYAPICRNQQYEPLKEKRKE